MTVAIPLKQQNNYNELKYALRSLCKQYSDCQLIIIGPKLPDWITKITHIDFPDAKGYEYKARNIFEKTLQAFEVTDRLLFMNDDHILLAQVNYSHHKGKIADNIASRNPLGCYTQVLKNTEAAFGDVYDFDTHCPIWYDKEKFEKLTVLDWGKLWGYGIKSSYCAVNEIEGEYYPDLKFMDKIRDYTDRLYFTVDDNCQLQGLQQLFPSKSKFEL